MKTNNLTLVLASVALAIIAAPSATAAAFQNGSFENGLTGWTLVADSGGERISNIEGATQGGVAFNFNAFQVNGTGVLAQAFSTVAGQTYMMSFDFGNYGQTSGFNSILQAEIRDGASAISGTQLIGLGSGFATVGNNTGFSLAQVGSIVTATDVNSPVFDTAFFTPVPTSPEFSTISIIFTALSGTSTIVFSDKTGLTGQFSDGVLDNVRLSAVPEPSTLALCGVGLVGLLYRRTRAGKNS